ncbi:MAG: hypothetical protein R2752_19935 [Vicinamibacterales bacterium]
MTHSIRFARVRRTLVSVAIVAAAVVAAFFGPPSVRAQSTPQPVPPVVQEAWEHLIGTWVADNAAYKGPGDPNDAFGIEWQWGLGRQSLVGRLYGIRDGKDIGTYWQFREFWHPGEGRIIATQFGSDGSYGAGPGEIRPDGSSEYLQTFWDPSAGTVTRVGHRATLEGDVHTTTSFDVGADDVWTVRRTYVWKRVRQ